MSTDLAFRKIHGHNVVPEDSDTEDYVRKLKPGAVIHGKFAKRNHAAFHRQLFAMLQLAFEQWQPGEIDCQYGTPQKNFERFRKDLTILAGFYEINHRIDGTFRVEAQSLSFGSMDHEQRQAVYNAILNVILDKIYNGTLSAEEMDGLVEQFMEFAG